MSMSKENMPKYDMEVDLWLLEDIDHIFLGCVSIFWNELFNFASTTPPPQSGLGGPSYASELDFKMLQTVNNNNNTHLDLL